MDATSASELLRRCNLHRMDQQNAGGGVEVRLHLLLSDMR